MTYEQSSTRGLEMMRSDGTLARYRDTVRRHFVAGLSTAETASRNRVKLLGDFYRYRESAIEEGQRDPIREYILPRGRDAASTDELAGILMEQGVEDKRTVDGLDAGGRTYASAHDLVPLAQPDKRLIPQLTDPQGRLDERFVR